MKNTIFPRKKVYNVVYYKFKWMALYVLIILTCSYLCIHIAALFISASHISHSRNAFHLFQLYLLCNYESRFMY